MKRKAFGLAAMGLLAALIFSSCGTIVPVSGEEGAASAQVILIQPSSTASFSAFNGLTVGTKFQLWDNDTWLGLVGSKDYIVYYASPGTHYFMARGENWDIIKVEIEAGKTYYMRTVDIPGALNIRVLFEAVDPENPELSKWLADSKQITPKEKASDKMLQDAQAALANVKSGSASSKDFPPGWAR